MKRLCLLCVSLVFSCAAFAQYGLHFKGKTANENIALYKEIDGSPYWKDWVEGEIVDAKGAVYRNIKLRLNAFSGQLHYLNRGQAFVPLLDVAEFRLFDKKLGPTIFRKGFPPVDEHTSSTYYIVLYDGTMKLLNQVRKTIEQQRNPATLSIRQHFEVNKDYYLYDGIEHTMVELKTSKRSLKEAFGKFYPKIKAFIEEKNTNLKHDFDMVQVIRYYDQLKGQ